MEYSGDKVMTRKEYLKTKKKGKFGIRSVKYLLLIIVIVLLGIYLFRQLDIYNNVTKIANKVVEETALAKTMQMYYLAETYSKDANPSVMLYKASDESRTKVEGTEGFSNIKLANGKLYGIVDGRVNYIDIETKQSNVILKENVKDYIVKDDKLYLYIESKDPKKTGIYVCDNDQKNIKQIINIKVYQMLIDDNYIYVVSKGKTEKSIVKYNLNGSGRTVLTNKEIVTNILGDKNYIYFISEELLYRIKKSGKDSEQIMSDELYVSSNLKGFYSANNVLGVKDDKIYYINKSSGNNLYAYNMKTKDKQVIAEKYVESIQLEGNMLYYKLNNNLGVYKVNLETGKSEKITSIRGLEYICVN